MELLLASYLNGIEVFLLVFVRMTGLFVAAPIFGRRNIPIYLKVGLSFIMAVILTSTAKINMPSFHNSIYFYLYLIINELLVGVCLGYISYLIFTAIYVAGQMIDMQIGFGMVNVMDPMSNIQVPITSNLYFIIGMLVFMGVNGHHILIKTLFDSYKMVPLGSAAFGSHLLEDIVRIFHGTFVIAFKIAAPVTATILVSDVALGVISRTVPQLNVFAVGMSLKIILGILVMMLTIPFFINLLGALFRGMEGEMLKFLKDLVLNNG